jgi:hypothetical protein
VVAELDLVERPVNSMVEVLVGRHETLKNLKDKLLENDDVLWL